MVVAPNIGTAVLLVVLNPVILEVVAAGKAIGVDAVLGVLEAPKTKTGLLIDDVEEVVDAPNENAGALDDPNAVVAVVVAVNALFVDVNELLVGAKVLEVKLNDLVVTCGNDVA